VRLVPVAEHFGQRDLALDVTDAAPGDGIASTPAS
jgi:hypothetical protein